MKLLKTMVKEEHEAVKVSFNSYDGHQANTPAVRIYGLSSEMRFGFNKMPTEIRIIAPDNSDSSVFFDVKDAVREKLKTLTAKNPEAASNVQDVLLELIAKAHTDTADNPVAKEYQDDIAEILDHLVVMLKARSIAFVHDQQQHKAKITADAIREIGRRIDDELAK